MKGFTNYALKRATYDAVKSATKTKGKSRLSEEDREHIKDGRRREKVKKELDRVDKLSEARKIKEMYTKVLGMIAGFATFLISEFAFNASFWAQAKSVFFVVVAVFFIINIIPDSAYILEEEEELE